MRKRKLWSLVLAALVMMVSLVGPVGAAEQGVGAASAEVQAHLAAMPDIRDVRIVDVTTYGHNSLAIDSNGHVWAWGDNRSGQLGIGIIGNQPEYSYVQVLNLTDVVKVMVEEYSCYAITSNGEVWAWGADNSSSIPQKVDGLEQIIDIASGRSHVLALKADGTVWSWGSNLWGQLGLGHTSSVSIDTPTCIDTINNVIAIAADTASSYALLEDGTVFSWGYNLYGQLGIGSASSAARHLVPTQMRQMVFIDQIDAGGTSFIALKSDGTVWACGDAIGLNSTSSGNVTVPIQIPGFNSATHVYAGHNNYIVKTQDDKYWVFGKNNYGLLGLAESNTSYTTLEPHEFALQNIEELSYSTCTGVALLEDGSVWGWGYNATGQLIPHDSVEIYFEPVLLFYPFTPIDPPDPDTYTITVTEHHTDSTPTVTNTYPVDSGDPFTASYESTGPIRSFEVSAADARVQADYVARTLTIDKVDRDITVTMVFGEGEDPVDPPDPSQVTLTNLVKDTDYSDLSDWYVVPDNAAMQTVGDELELTIDSSDSMYYITVRQDLNLDITHQYYLRAGMYMDMDSFPGLTTANIRLNLGNNELETVTYTGGWTDISTVGSPSHNGNNRFQMLFRFGPTGAYLGGTMRCREPMLIDLTEAFGAGNEPTAAWCDANIPFFDGTTTISV